MNEIEMYINVLKGRASILLLASVKKSHLLELRVVARNSRKNIHSYLEIEGELDWKFKKGNWLFVNTDSSGLISIDGRSVFGLDPKHRNFRIPSNTNQIRQRESTSFSLQIS